ncbi:MAG: HAMP domain-containing histidine kinase [Clostridiales bacterium]|nr:HAMP domain-containing histidine kinase [Clostridiales bacterium]
MEIILIFLFGILVILLIYLYRIHKQLNIWSDQIEHTDIRSNQRLSTTIRTDTFCRLCRAVNKRLEEGQQSRIQEEHSSNELKYTISCVSHDIRTPLTSVTGYFELLQETEDPEKQQRYKEIIQHRLKDLERMLDELFLYTKLSQKEYQLDCNFIQPFPILCETIAENYNLITAAGLELKISFAEETIEIFAEAEALRRIFQNLIQNATVHGGQYLVIEQIDHQLLFRNYIKEQDEMDITRLFDRFYKSDHSRHHTSSGLGLSIVKQLMDKMGASVDAVLENSEFVILLTFHSNTK